MSRRKQTKDEGTYIVIGVIVFIMFTLFISALEDNDYDYENYTYSEDPHYLHILSSFENASFEDDLRTYASKNDIEIDITYQGDIDIIDTLNSDPSNYDAVWISNSMWLYMLDNPYLYSESKSVSISPVIFGIKKSKAESLGLVGKSVSNNDIVKLIQDKKISYVMSSVTRTNTGATAYFGFVNSLAGNPEVLSIEHLKNKKIQEDLKAIFSGVERVSGDEDYLKEMFLNSEEYEAVIADESALIEINKELQKNKREELYFIYPSDGVAINDSTFAFVSGVKEKKDTFLKLQQYLLSKEGKTLLEQKGKRTWYGGVKEDVDKTVFNPKWGVDTTKTLIVTKYPSKNVMNEALNIYVELLRKPTHVVFCLDYSGSMSGNRIEELKGAMDFILNREEASKERLQFSEKDRVSIIIFQTRVSDPITANGDKVEELLNRIHSNYVSGSTALFPSVRSALEVLKKENDDYTKVVIAMTDGEANVGSFRELEDYYNNNKLNIPVYSIAFGEADERQLGKISSLTNGKTFNGKAGLLQAFKEVRGYN